VFEAETSFYLPYLYALGGLYKACCFVNDGKGKGKGKDIPVTGHGGP
jgi:hypothetical protein